ncbi:MAG: Rhodanese-related sulfurtransferase [Verrucomicrobiales bacterium]|nr:Rhodanese-related sulfurtransferase [Verrucomicrobiales bacterium]
MATMLSLIPSVIKGMTVGDLEKIKKICRGVFPTARQVSTKRVAEWMGEPKSCPLLIDVRSPKEFAVSHLPGALNLRSADAISRAIAERATVSRTVLYCSVGFRSSRLASELQREIKNVMNLEGSIFEWANEGRSLFQGEQPTKKVHPFGKIWAGLLKPGLASPGD